MHTHVDIIIERLRQRCFLCCQAFSEQLKEDGPWLISMYVYYNNAFTETDQGPLLELGHLLV